MDGFVDDNFIHYMKKSFIASFTTQWISCKNQKIGYKQENSIKNGKNSLVYEEKNPKYNGLCKNSLASGEKKNPLIFPFNSFYLVKIYYKWEKIRSKITVFIYKLFAVSWWHAS
eukprot:TRINITY_DN2894_c0_g1_i3.p5 TRINITY_DN2894_c0_g1~~TRINITY_DN2894_c0_g1_i3.p5  ORF type:complete len:114 (-),score=7.62 TRINITY_DN2894_c0_g1_i3:80-421(-)